MSVMIIIGAANLIWTESPLILYRMPIPLALPLRPAQDDVYSSNSDAVTADLVKKGYILDNRPGTLMVLIPDSKHDTSPLSKLGVRQAISYAIDRDSIAKTLGYGFWEVENQPSAAYQFGHIDPSQVPYKYDPAKARQLLTAAGYPNGFSTSIIYTTTFGNSDPLLAMQSALKDIGINVNLIRSNFPPGTICKQGLG